jgi:hypothetical protein
MQFAQQMAGRIFFVNTVNSKTIGVKFDLYKFEENNRIYGRTRPPHTPFCNSWHCPQAPAESETMQWLLKSAPLLLSRWFFFWHVSKTWLILSPKSFLSCRTNRYLAFEFPNPSSYPRRKLQMELRSVIFSHFLSILPSGPNTLHCALVFNIPKLLSSTNEKDQRSRSYITTGKIIKSLLWGVTTCSVV